VAEPVVAEPAAQLDPVILPEPTLDFDAPPLPLGISEPAGRPAGVQGLATLRNIGGGRREESDEDRAARARVPSWDDILLGVRRKSD
jgi:hypothetical protein